MRRLSKPTSLSLGLAQLPHSHHQQRPPSAICSQKRFFPGPPLSSYPEGVILKEGKGPQKERFPIVDVPDVLLDLDAEDSPYVRPYDVVKDWQLGESIWGYDPNVDGASKEAKQIKETLSKQRRNVERLQASPFPRAQLSDHDILSVALRVQPIDGDDPLEDKRLEGIPSRLRSDCVRNGVPLFILRRDTNTVLPFMLSRRRDALAALQDPSFCKKSDESDATVFKQTISACKTLEEVRKLVSCIDNPISGVKLGPASIDHVHKTLVELLHDSGDSSAVLEANLKFVSNLTIKRLTRGQPLNRSMTLFGLQLSSKLGLLPSIVQYLQICKSMGFMGQSSTSLENTRIQVARAILQALQAGQATARGTRLQLFTLLTGQNSLPDGSKTRTSLLGLDKTDRTTRPEIYQLRVQLLAELGAVRSLWLQYHDSADQLFVSAFRRCAQILGGAKDGGRTGKRVDIVMSTAIAGLDAADDLRTINAFEAFGPEGLDPKVEIPEEDILRAFQQLNMADALRYFSQMIVQAEAQSGGN